MATGDIVIKKYVPGSDVTVQYTFRVRNRDSIDIDITSGVMSDPMPEDSKAKQILVKISGNSMTITAKFRVKDQAVSYVDETGAAGYPINTISKVIDFLANTFENTSIDQKYVFELEGLAGMSFEGVVTNTKLSSTVSDGTTWQGTIVFSVGEVVAL